MRTGSCFAGLHEDNEAGPLREILKLRQNPDDASPVVVDGREAGLIYFGRISPGRAKSSSQAKQRSTAMASIATIAAPSKT
jgi:hypothetical protein